MNKSIKAIALISIFIVLPACQTNKLNSDRSASAAEPRLITDESDLGKKYLWGGEILAVENLQQTTEITVISYPLNRNEKPDYNKQSTGRFIAAYPGFLEPTDYQKGKLITVIGNLQEFRNGKIAAADYRFPVLVTDKVSLHGNASKGYRLPFTIGIGIGIHN